MAKQANIGAVVPSRIKKLILMRIFLIGFMGCGKSFIGQKLAQLAGLPFYDLDGYIESKTDMPIPQIFAQHGEPHFRALEQQHLHHFAQLNAFVLSCGGGTPCFYDNIDWINAQGISVYLNCPPELLSTRLQTQRTGRPLLASLSDAELLAFITQKLSERAPYYEQAHIQFAVQANDDFTPQLLSQIKALPQHLHTP